MDRDAEDRLVKHHMKRARDGIKRLDGQWFAMDRRQRRLLAGGIIGDLQAVRRLQGSKDEY
jgi:hypothetical protein